MNKILKAQHIARIDLLANAILETIDVVEIHTVAREILYEIQQIKDSEKERWQTAFK
jgi:hypothetical protein